MQMPLGLPGVTIVGSLQRIGVVPPGAWPQFAYIVWYSLRSCTAPRSMIQLHRALPARPFFVVTRTTPFAAAVPYNVAADGPLTISMSSISSGLNELSIENDVWPFKLVVPASNRTPSTIQIGAFERLIE